MLKYNCVTDVRVTSKLFQKVFKGDFTMKTNLKKEKLKKMKYNGKDVVKVYFNGMKL